MIQARASVGTLSEGRRAFPPGSRFSRSIRSNPYLKALLGISVHPFNFLRYAHRSGAFGATATLGRQGLHVKNDVVLATFGGPPDYSHEGYCEDLLLRFFGATRVDSIDYSEYESASFVHDMNRPLPATLEGQFDTVIDSGTIEHVFNAPQAFDNVSRMCGPGAQILHVLPANNFCGHGFWQFSPALFFALYSKANGYAGTEVFIADLADANPGLMRVDVAAAVQARLA